jgi:hypothetical protein
MRAVAFFERDLTHTNDVSGFYIRTSHTQYEHSPTLNISKSQFKTYPLSVLKGIPTTWQAKSLGLF